MATLFEQTSINNMAMQNRIVRSATWEGMCDEDGRQLICQAFTSTTEPPRPLIFSSTISSSLSSVS